MVPIITLFSYTENSKSQLLTGCCYHLFHGISAFLPPKEITSIIHRPTLLCLAEMLVFTGKMGKLVRTDKVIFFWTLKTTAQTTWSAPCRLLRTTLPEKTVQVQHVWQLLPRNSAIQVVIRAGTIYGWESTARTFFLRYCRSRGDCACATALDFPLVHSETKLILAFLWTS